eukprot:NODE_12501_length_1221_cov_5.093236.p1 GENE.NODE_12501_length_1221_cov_5.093236~~NODE_12501_length_1221_cov_5.093236.p1  ORF type:complete len:232 (-),score=47.04 NODE_12501_length_1221_cov_5.093236:51-746(-)
MEDFNCTTDVPVACCPPADAAFSASEYGADYYTYADYVFSAYMEQKPGRQALPDCYFNGSTIYAPASIYHKRDSGCVCNADPATTPLDEQGWRALLKARSSDRVVGLMSRILSQRHEKIDDGGQARDFAAKVLTNEATQHLTFAELSTQLVEAPWTCGGKTDRVCSSGGGGSSSGGTLALILIGVALVGCVGGCGYCYYRSRRTQRPSGNALLLEQGGRVAPQAELHQTSP